MLNQSKYIKLTQFKNLFFWDYYTLCNKLSIESNYPILELREVISQRKEFVVIEDQLQYKRCRVQLYGNGVVLRDEVYGSAIKTKKQQLCKQDEFLVAEIDAKFGGYGIVPSSLERAIVSGHYFLFDINKQKLSPDFLGIVLKCTGFSKQVKATGSTNYAAIRPYHVLGYKMPLPSLAEQNTLVTAYNDLIETANNQDSTSTTLEQQIETYLLAQLGVTISKTKKKAGLNFVSFKDVSRWDIAYFFSNSELKSRFANVRLEDCLSRFMKSDQGKSIRVETYKQPTTKFHYIGMEHVMRDTGELVEMPEVLGADIKSQTTAIPQGYFIYGKLRPYLNKYWFNDTGMEDIVCSSEFFVFKIKEAINEAFFKYIISSVIVQKQIEELTSGARMPRINEDIFKNIIIPMPPLDVQNEIVAHITGLKGQIKQLRTAAITNRTSALTEFEQKIFK